jgi:hypothetical protein
LLLELELLFEFEFDDELSSSSPPTCRFALKRTSVGVCSATMPRNRLRRPSLPALAGAATNPVAATARATKEVSVFFMVGSCCCEARSASYGERTRAGFIPAPGWYQRNFASAAASSASDSGCPASVETSQASSVSSEDAGA